jgi:hypothetical protein
MSQLLIQNIVTENVYDSFQNAVLVALKDKDVEKLMHVFNRLLARIPYDDYKKAMNQDIMFDDFKFPAQEWLYRSTTFSLLLGCGVQVTPEVHSNMGRSDLVFSFKGVTWVIEFKVAYRDKGDDPAEKVKEAIRQIEEKNYAKLYPQTISVGLAIDDSVRQITNWETVK